MVAGLVLAGGRSRRFGSDKRFYKIDGKTLIQIACEKIAALCPENYLVVDKHFDIKHINIQGINIIRDVEEYKGPLVGIYSALLQVQSEGCMVIPVDMPHLTMPLLEYIKNKAKRSDLIVLYDNEYLPLPGFYSYSLLPLMKSSLDKKDYSLRSLVRIAEGIDKLRVLKLNLRVIRKFGKPEKILFNINSVNDIVEK
ncbi:MAG: NTP transferase domain-containing protein [Candidatus Dadabacteria bacterium]|nr:NTP transferase domain-containing protein [Candidatus Dadabacteria bacterium]